MSVGTSTRCRVCTHKRRVEIDRRLLAGQPARGVSKWLAQQGDPISNVSIGAHKSNHLNIKAQAAAAVNEETAAAFAAGIKKVVADANLLDDLAGYAMSTVEMLAPQMGDPSMAQATAYAAVMREIPNFIELREKLLGGNKRQTAAERPNVTIRYAVDVTPISQSDPDADHAEPAAEPGPSGTSSGE
jgi:hypothetical protein